MKLPKDFEELMKGIKWNRIIPPMVSVLQPVIIFGLWLGLTKVDKRADAVSKIIAIAEPIPTIDLNIPRPVVLASLYHATDEALDVLKDVIDFLQDIEIPSADEIIEEAKDEIKDVVDEATGKGIDDPLQVLADFNACKRNAKNNLGIAYNKVTGYAWITSCMVQKGYTRKIIEQWVKNKMGI